MSTCPCCSDRLLRHIRQGSLYWFCRTCWSEMPNLESYDRPRVTAGELKPIGVHALPSHTSHFTRVIQHPRSQKTAHPLLVS